MTADQASIAIQSVAVVVSFYGWYLYFHYGGYPHGDPEGRDSFWTAISMVIFSFGATVDRAWGVAGFFAALAALLFWVWWHTRKKRRRSALAWAGYKARAARAAILARLRDNTAPAPG
jgi:hypothetical protein